MRAVDLGWDSSPRLQFGAACLWTVSVVISLPKRLLKCLDHTENNPTVDPELTSWAASTLVNHLN